LLFGTANKKSKLINNNPQECGFNTSKSNQHKQNEQANGNIKKTKASGKVHQQQTGAFIPHSSVDAEQYLNQDHDSLYNGIASDLKRGPNSVKVLPIIAFPNSSANESNHLVKPSEYLRSIVTDKRSSPR
jgi:hypothetical protein